MHIDISENMSLCILRLICVRSVEEHGGKKLFYHCFLFNFFLKVLLVSVVHPLIEFRPDHDRLSAFFDQQESYIFLSLPSRC